MPLSKWYIKGLNMKTAYVVFVLVLLVSGVACGTSLWSGANNQTPSLYSDHKARGIGDIITIIIDESSSSSKDAKTTTDKSTNVEATIDSVLYPSSELLTHDDEKPLWQWASASSYEGGGSSKNKQDFEAKMTARVIEVQPNGNLVIEGRRTVHLAASTQYIILTGVIRPRDISGNNTIYSSYISDATITYDGKGDLNYNQNPGFLTRLWNWVNVF